MKNPHGVEPTRFMKREESKYAIYCDRNRGPTFIDIHINDNCNIVNSCFINNDGTRGYECNPEYKSSLFVNTGRPDEENNFTVLDYEVYYIESPKDYICYICKHPDIIWEYIETKDISEESLSKFSDDTELLNDLDVLCCKNSAIRLKISNYHLKNPSELLVNTQIVNRQYDSYLREWAGDYKWKLLYRASENEYSAKSFHKYCDNKGPTVVIIKSSGGWIFGGYTTQSWSGDGIYYDMHY